MFVIPAGIILGAKVSLADWWLFNQLPVTFGNLLGGVVFTTLALYYTFHKNIKLKTRDRINNKKAPVDKQIRLEVAEEQLY